MLTGVSFSTLSADDINALNELYGTDYAQAWDDLNGSSYSSDVSKEDLFAWLVLYTEDVSDFDPDKFLDDSDMVDLANDMRDALRGEDDLDDIVAELEAYLEAAGQPTDALNDAIRIMNEYGPQTTGSSDEEMMNMIEFFKATNPYLYLLLYSMYELGPKVEDAAQDVIAAMDDNWENYEDGLDMVVDAAGSDDRSDQADAQEGQSLMELAQQKNTSLSESLDLIMEAQESILETVSNGLDRLSRTTNVVIQGIGQ